MIPLLCIVSPDARTAASGPQPSYVVTIRDDVQRKPGAPSRPGWRVASYRVGRQVGNEGGTIVRQLARVGEVSYATPGIAGSLGTLPQPGSAEFALLHRDERAYVRYVDVWSAHPLRRIASVPCKDTVRVDWLPGRSALAIVERHTRGFDTRIVDSNGRDVRRLPQTMGVVAGPDARTYYAVRYALPWDRLVDAVDAGDGNDKMARALRAGTVSFAKLGADGRVARTLSARSAARVMLGPGGTIDALASIAPPHRPIGFAQNWAIVRAAVLGSPPGTGIARIYDQLGFPNVNAKLVRAQLEDWSDAHSVSNDGTLLYSNASGDGYRARGGREGDSFAEAIGAKMKRYWWLRGAGPSLRSVVLWKN